MDFKAIGSRIRNKRLELNWTQEKLAEKTNLTDAYIGAIERATSKCSIETLVKMAQALNLNVDFMLFGTTLNNIDFRISSLIKDFPEDKQKLYIEICESIAEKFNHIIFNYYIS